MSTTINLEQLRRMAQEEGFSLCMTTPLSEPLTFSHYSLWIEKNYHGSMQYLESHKNAKEFPQQAFPTFKTVITLAHSYLPHPSPNTSLTANRIALYAQGDDYHHWIRQKLQNIISKIKQLTPNSEFLDFVDSGPILERDWAYKAGLGWFGKNTCIINPKHGSLFFLSEIITDLIVPSDLSPSHDFCGTCNRCIEVCPTAALEEPRVLNATKCISFWTIESKTPPPPELREKIGDWLFGCDLCQTVCPWNQKIFGGQLETSKIRDTDKKTKAAIAEELRFILQASGKQLSKYFRNSPLSRAGTKGLKRNAIIVATNLKLVELRTEIESLRENSYFTELCDWSTQRLS